MGGGGGGAVRMGLLVNTLHLNYNADTHRLVRVSEASLVSDDPNPATTDAIRAQAAEDIRKHGIRMGMRFNPTHRIVSVNFAAGNAEPPQQAYITLAEDSTVTAQLDEVFGDEPGWMGLFIRPEDIRPEWQPQAPHLPYPPKDDRIYFAIDIANFRPRHDFSAYVVPVVVALGNVPDFTTHYLLGISVYSRGTDNQAPQFDSMVIMHA